MRKHNNELVEYFRGEGCIDGAWGDCEGWSPEHTAVMCMKRAQVEIDEQAKEIAALRAHLKCRGKLFLKGKTVAKEHIGWFDPGSRRFQYTDVKAVDIKRGRTTGYTIPVYAIRDQAPSRRSFQANLDVLRAGEGDTVLIPCDCPEGDERGKVKVIVCGRWTGWRDVDFWGDSLDDAVVLAADALKAWKAKEKDGDTLTQAISVAATKVGMSQAAAGMFRSRFSLSARDGERIVITPDPADLLADELAKNPLLRKKE